MNFLVFMPDQLRFDATLHASTPSLEALKAQGTTFTSAYSQHSVCSPSRVSMLTGWYPHVAGHRTLTHLLKPWEPNLLALLRDAGVHVAWAGHRGDAMAVGVTEASTDFCGFTVKPEVLAEEPYHASVPLAEAYHFGARPGPTLDFDEAAVRTAEELLSSGRLPEPWLLFVPLVFPHPPFTVEEPWYSLHDRSSVPAPAGGGSGKAAHLAALADAYGTSRLSSDDWAEIVATYYGMVSRVDAQLGRLLDRIDHDRTATLFFTDHGEYLGDHGAVEKWPSGLDDVLLRNPLVASAPGLASGQATDALVEMVDLLPTLLELSGGVATHSHFGRSLVPLLSDASVPHRDAAFSEGGYGDRDRDRMERVPFGHYKAKIQLQVDRPDLVARCTSVRTPEWTYVHRATGAHELYDRVGDPHELTNLASSRADVVTSMQSRVLDWLVETSDVIPPDEDPRFPRIPQGWRD
jgi:arylsulfatase A-like enzyme